MDTGQRENENLTAHSDWPTSAVAFTPLIRCFETQSHLAFIIDTPISSFPREPMAPRSILRRGSYLFIHFFFFKIVTTKQ